MWNGILRCNSMERQNEQTLRRLGWENNVDEK
jgi:hypothetical protein